MESLAARQAEILDKVDGVLALQKEKVEFPEYASIYRLNPNKSLSVSESHRWCNPEIQIYKA